MTAPGYSGMSGQDVAPRIFSALDAVAPWEAVLQGSFGRRAPGVWERHGDVYRVAGAPPSSRLIEDAAPEGVGWSPSEALVEFQFDGDRAMAGRSLSSLLAGQVTALSVSFNSDAIKRLQAALPASDEPVAEPEQAVELTSAAAECPVLTDVRDFIARYVVLSDPLDYEVVALWVGHTYLMDAFEVTPRLAFLSPQRSSGKTRGLDVLDLLFHGPLQAVSVSTASLFRSIAQANRSVTLLLDEVDTIFQAGNSSAEEIRGILNGGYKRGASVMRAGSKSKDFQVERFSVFAAVAMAGLGRLPDTLMSRSIVMSMRRRRSDEPVQGFRRRDVEEEATDICGALAVWATSVLDRVALPALPAELTDRAAEIWEPLLAVADLAGPGWAARARVAAVAAVAGSAGTDDQDTKLLAGIKTVFDKTETARSTPTSC